MPNSYFLLLLTLISILIPLSQCQIHNQNQNQLFTFESPSSPGAFWEKAVYVYGSRRFLGEGPSTGGDESPLNSTYLVLAPKRTHRRDPFDGFKKYSGGWNISNKHYWASVAFTAVPFFVVAAVWFLAFGLFLFCFCLCYCCCRREPYGYSKVAYALSLILLILFTICAIAGSIVLYTGQAKFHNSSSKTLDYIVDTADNTVEALRNVSGYLDAAKDIGVVQVFLPANVQADITNIQTKINSSANMLDGKAEDNSHKIRKLLNSVGLALVIIAAVMLLLAFIGFLFSLCGMQCLVQTLVIVGWVLVAGTFVLCGVFLLLHNVTADTCISMNQWVQNPLAQTALDDILPCIDNTTARETLSKSKEVTSQLVNVINKAINSVTNSKSSPLFYNQSGPLVPILCNPFNSDLTNRSCVQGEVDLNNATEVWGGYVCQVTRSGICTTTGRITPDIYHQMSAGVNVSYGLYHYGPFLVELQDCTFVRKTFSDITRDHCPGLRNYSRWIYIGLLMVSVAVMLSLVFWFVYGRERRHRVYTKHLLADTPAGFEGDKYT